MLVCFTGCFIACGKDENILNSSEDVDVQSDNNEVNDKTSDDENIVEKVDEDNTDKITEEVYRGTGIYYDYPSKMKYVDEILDADILQKSKANQDITIVITCDSAKEFKGTLEDVIDNRSDRITRAFRNKIWDWAFETLDVKSSENVKMAGYDSIKFTATTTNASIDDIRWDCYVYGYAFIINDLPYVVVGVVAPEDQEQSMIDEMIADVDAIAGSIRTEE